MSCHEGLRHEGLIGGGDGESSKEEVARQPPALQLGLRGFEELTHGADASAERR